MYQEGQQLVAYIKGSMVSRHLRIARACMRDEPRLSEHHIDQAIELDPESIQAQIAASVLEKTWNRFQPPLTPPPDSPGPPD